MRSDTLDTCSGGAEDALDPEAEAVLDFIRDANLAMRQDEALPDPEMYVAHIADVEARQEARDLCKDYPEIARAVRRAIGADAVDQRDR